ncbi:MAG TPA: patatin-like protein, partial [Gaiellaceae bacterium]|nr:patatin-like protein [Gaiellaceae bacterium]
KELHRLVKGSALLDAASGEGSASELVYGRLLDELAQKNPEQLRTRVVVDVIAGTSAGGINGVCLAKALAHNRSLDDFRDLWFDKGDIDGLLAAPRWLAWRPLKAAWVALRGLKHAPLRGDLMAQWIYDAFDKMDRKGSSPAGIDTLMPDRHKLELFVTATDFYGYGRQVPFADPNPIQDRRHRHVLGFRFGGDDGRDDFDTNSNGALTFAARTTSCIPGVFPPVSFDALKGWLGDGRPVDFDDLDRRFFRLYELAKFPAAWTWFVDGGVLDNKPFGPAIEAIRERPADLQVDRRLLYLEPDPGVGLSPTHRKPPSTLAAAVGGLTGLPRSEPILDDLVEVGALNERVRRIQDIIETSWDTIDARVREIAGPLPAIPKDPADPQLAEIRTKTAEEARKSAGFSYATYVRLKISGVVDHYAETACLVADLPPDSTHALIARSALRRWAEDRGLFEQRIEPSKEQIDFLVNFDLAFAERRLRFVIDGLSHLYPNAGKPGYPQREQIDEAKGQLWQAVVTLRDAGSGKGFDEELRGRFDTCFSVEPMREFMQTQGFDADAYAEKHRTQLDELEAELGVYLKNQLSGFTADLYTGLLQLTEGWDDERRWDLLVRYLGFPFWDVLLYPIQALSDVGERDHVQIVRLSPRDSHRIPVPGDDKHKKLIGAEKGHFGAFLSRRGREQDYLWGRLDGAERFIGILLSGAPEEEKERWCKEAFRAILEEDEQAVPKAAALADRVRRAVGP